MLETLLPSLAKAKKSGAKKKPRKMSGKFKFEVYEQMASFIEDGFTPFQIAEMLAVEYAREKGDPRAKFYRYLTIRLREGDKLSRALTGLVPQEDLYVIEAAESSGRLAQGFKRLIYFTQKKDELRGKMFSLLKPLAMAVAALGILYGFSSSVLPDFATMVTEEQRGAATTSLMAMGDWLEIYTLPIVAGIIAYFLISAAFLSSLSHPLRDRFLNKFLPPWNFYQMFVSNSFLLTLGTMMESGMRPNVALGIVKQFSGPYLSFHIDIMERSLAQGSSDARAIATELFDKESARKLRTLGRAGQLEETMQKIAQRSIEASMKRVDTIVDSANVAMKLVIASIVIWIVFAIGGVILPMIQNTNLGV